MSQVITLESLLREVEYMPCYADWRERRELKHLHICSGIILQMQDERWMEIRND